MPQAEQEASPGDLSTGVAASQQVGRDEGLSVLSAWGLSHSLPGARECPGLRDDSADCPVWTASQRRKATFAGALE